MSLPFRNAPQIQEFVHAAVRLPHSRLRAIKLQWESLHVHRSVIRELVQASRDVRKEMEQLREYVTRLAQQADASGETTGPLVPEDIAEAALPAARAVLLRDALEFSADQRRAQAFTALTEPFRDILPRSKHSAERRGDR